MGRAQSGSILSQSIAEILGTAAPAISTAERHGSLRKSLVYTSMALLAINPAAVNAVGLGELSVNSRLGQPLDATVPITLGQGESLPKDCVAPTRGNSGLETPSKLRVSTPAATQPGTYNLRVTTTNALHEPMYEISLLIDCPGTPLLLRQYMLMLDLPGMGGSPPAATSRGDTLTVPAAAAQSSSRPVTRMTAPATNLRATRSLQRSHTAIPAGRSYRVSEGDTLSTIAARVDGRAPNTTWSVANLIFASNPHAFIRNNPDLIKLGSLIDIPDAQGLAGLERGRQPIPPIAVVEPAIAEPVTIGEPQPMPAPAPVAAPLASSQQEVFVTEPETNQSEPATPDNTGMTGTNLNDGVDVAEEAFQPFAAQPTTASVADATGDEAIITPFLDEQQPVPTVEFDAGAAAVPAADPIPVVTTTPRSEPSDPVNPLLAILVGLILGALISLLTLRRQLIDALIGLARRLTPADAVRIQTPKSTPARNDQSTTVDVEAFETSVAESAFDTHQEDSEPLPIVGPTENTYIVEASEAEATAQVQALEALKTPEFDTGTLENKDGLQENPDDEVLAQLFDDSDSTFGEPDPEIFDPTGGLDTAATGTFAGPTAEMPVQVDEQSLDPTAEFEGEIFDPTAQMPSGQPDLLLDETAEAGVNPDDALDPSLMNALDENLEQIDADEMFATANNLVDDFLDGPPPSEIPDEPTLESGLDALPSGDEDGLSATLQEALSLLERDYEDEFTASQILERSEINRSLEAAGAEDAKDEEDADPPERKVSG